MSEKKEKTVREQDKPQSKQAAESGKVDVLKIVEGVPGAEITNTRVASKDNKGDRAIVIIEYQLDGKTGSYGFDYEKDANGAYELKRFGEGVRTDDLM